MALCLVVNDINKQIRQLNESNRNDNLTELKPIKMPKSVLNLYAPYNLTLNISPSMILASCDSMISAGVMLSCFEAYLPLVDFNDTTPISESLPSTSESKFSLNSLTRSISSLISSNENKLEIEAFDDGRLNADEVKDSSDWLEFIQTNNIYVQIMDLIQGLIGNLKCKF